MFKLFDNPGKKIKMLALILFCVEVVACIVMAFAFGWSRQYTHYYGYTYARTQFNVVRFLMPLICGPACAFVSNLMLYAFGELVENSSRKSSDCGCKTKSGKPETCEKKSNKQGCCKSAEPCETEPCEATPCATCATEPEAPAAPVIEAPAESEQE